MFQGFYNLTSGMLTQTKNLNVISNNMSNVATPGYKSEAYISTTFQEEMLYRMGNKHKSNATPIGTTAMRRVSSENVISYKQGAYDQTGGNLDFALTGTGFFQVQTEDGVRYTRNGSFFVDEEGYLALQGIGRVLGEDGPIQMTTDNIAVSEDGTIASDSTKAVLGKIQVVDFENYDQIEKADSGLFQTQEQGQPVNTQILWKSLERSNVNPMQEMTSMISTQGAFRSAAQILKMYDQIMQKATTEIGRI